MNIHYDYRMMCIAADKRPGKRVVVRPRSKLIMSGLISSFFYPSMALQSFIRPWPLFSFLVLYTVGSTSWTEDQSVARPLPTHRTTQTQNKRKQTSMAGVGFEPRIPAFERAKTVHTLDRAATLIGKQFVQNGNILALPNWSLSGYGQWFP
jgi:hypothetical protein